MSTKAYRWLDKLEPSFKKKVEKFMAKVNDKVFITETWRSEDRQRELIESGASKTSRSNHQDWLAIDIAFLGSELYPSNHRRWEDIAIVAKQYWMDWWYDLWAHLGFVDKPHFQDNWVPLSGPYRKLAGETVINNAEPFGWDEEVAKVQIIVQREFKKLVNEYTRTHS